MGVRETEFSIKLPIKICYKKYIKVQQIDSGKK